MNRRANSGVTLIELMIVVVIIGILAGIAYPSYRSYLKQSRRSDAQIALTQAASKQEKFLADCNWYARVANGVRACGTAGATDSILGISNTTPSNHYTLQITAGNITGGCAAFTCGFTIKATPTAGGQQVGDGAFQIDAIGNKQWDRNNNGSFEAGENSWDK